MLGGPILAPRATADPSIADDSSGPSTTPLPGTGARARFSTPTPSTPNRQGGKVTGGTRRGSVVRLRFLPANLMRTIASMPQLSRRSTATRADPAVRVLGSEPWRPMVADRLTRDRLPAGSVDVTIVERPTIRVARNRVPALVDLARSGPRGHPSAYTPSIGERAAGRPATRYRSFSTCQRRDLPHARSTRAGLRAFEAYRWSTLETRPADGPSSGRGRASSVSLFVSCVTTWPKDSWGSLCRPTPSRQAVSTV